MHYYGAYTCQHAGNDSNTYSRMRDVESSLPVRDYISGCELGRSLNERLNGDDHLRDRCWSFRSKSLEIETSQWWIQAFG